MATDPSPTADATRFTEPLRTSPAANTPGRLVSSGSGRRSRGHEASSPRSGPVTTKPRSSLAISGGSQSVRGRAPIMRKSPSAGTVCSAPVPRSRSTRCSSRPAPPPSTTSVPRRTSIVRCRLHLSDEVLRHPCIERGCADDQRDARRVPREMERGLPRRVRAADHVGLAAGHGGRLRRGASVEHARAVQRLERRDPDPLVRGARGEQHRAAADASAVREGDRQAGVISPELRDVLHEGELGAEDPRLLVRLAGEPTTAHAPSEAEVVADEGARGRLAADAPWSTTRVSNPSDAP